MFEHFTFAAAPSQPYQHDDSYPSPKDDSLPPPTFSSDSSSYFPSYQPFNPINDIVYKFSQQSLSFDEEESQNYLSPTPSLEPDDEISPTQTNNHYESQSMPATPVLPTRGGTVACRRLQRQLNVQLQSCSTHIRDINTLVEDMLNKNSQCCLRQPRSRSNLAVSSTSSPVRMGFPPTYLEVDPMTQGLDEEVERMGRGRGRRMEEIDEGFVDADDEEKEDEEMSLRRASTPAGIRKHGALRYRASAECVSGCKMKVNKPPRMRIRRPGFKGGKLLE